MALITRFKFTTWWGPFAVLGAALIVGVLFSLVDVGRMIAFPFGLFIHELGHAIPSWFSGRAALPLPVGFTMRSDDQSIFVFLCMSFLIGLFLFRSIRERARFAIGVGVVAALVLLWGYFVLDSVNSFMHCLLGGLMGEIVVPGVIFILFHYELPSKLRWDFWRLLAVFPATFAYFPALFLWIRASGDSTQIPRGGILGDGMGDIERLQDIYGWTDASLSSLYLTTAIFVGIAVIVHSAVHMALAMRGGDPDPPTKTKAPPAASQPPREYISPVLGRASRFPRKPPGGTE